MGGMAAPRPVGGPVAVGGAPAPGGGGGGGGRPARRGGPALPAGGAAAPGVGPGGPPRAPACHSAVHHGILPTWARTGFSDPRPRLPHVIGRSGEIAALVFGYP